MGAMRLVVDSPKGRPSQVSVDRLGELFADQRSEL